jgi:hypothetical protein
MTNSDSNARVEVLSTPSAIDVHEDPGTLALTEELEARGLMMSTVLDKYEFVDANADQGYIIMAEKGKPSAKGHALLAANKTSDISEIGAASPSPWTSYTREEWVSELRGREGLTQFYRMKRQDGLVRGSLRGLKTPLLSAHWYMKPGTNTPADQKVAKFVSNNLFKDLNVSWFNLLNDVLLCAEYGYMPFEKVWNPPKLEGGKFVQKLRKLAPRHPLDVSEFIYDEHGGPDAIEMEGSIDNPTEPRVTIPISKLVIFNLEGEAGDLTGISVLRSVYKHWYYKDTLYKIDGIQKERHGIGIPVIKLPLGWSPDDKKKADELGRNLRTNERAHVVLPPNWELLFAKVEGQMVDCMKSIEHHDMAIMANVLGAWIKETSAKSDSLDMFMKSTRYIAACITDIMNRYVVREIVDKNFTLGPNREYPELVCRRIGEWEDLRTQSFTVRNLVGAGVIEPDDVLEETFREELDMPPKDYATARKMVTEPGGIASEVDENGNPIDDPNHLNNGGKGPGGKGTAAKGGSRQQNLPPSGSGRSNTGVDRSGG